MASRIRRRCEDFEFWIRNHIQHMGRRSRFSRELEQLRREDLDNSERDRFRTCDRNQHRNRYRNVRCDESTRVRLQDTSRDRNDYINANRIRAEHYDHPGYIATQAPIRNTVRHFWQMVYESRSPAIIMLCNERERVDRYWPHCRAHWNLGRYRVENLWERRHPRYPWVERRFRISRICRDGPIRSAWTVVHLNYTAWSDGDVPRSLTDSLKLREKAQRFSFSKRHRRKTGPLIVHCLAGLGRTGTFIAIDQMLLKVWYVLTHPGERDFKNISFKHLVRKLKAARFGMVQTDKQYRFIHEAIASEVSRWKRA